MPLEDNQTELHLLILWDTTIPTAKDVYSRALHERTFSTVKVEVRPSIASRVARIAFMNAFYEASRHNKDVDDIRGTCPFVVMFVHARRSDYGQCLGGSATRHVARCAPTNAFKSRVRAQTHTRTSVYAIHGTDNVEETRDNLRVLGFNTDDYETLAQQRRVSWPSLEVMLAAIDGAGGMSFRGTSKAGGAHRERSISSLAMLVLLLPFWVRCPLPRHGIRLAWLPTGLASATWRSSTVVLSTSTYGPQVTATWMLSGHETCLHGAYVARRPIPALRHGPQ